MTKHGRKMVAPIIITVIYALYLIGYSVLVIWLEPPWYVLVFGILSLICLAGVLTAMLIERIKEIRSGEEDDLSKY